MVSKNNHYLNQQKSGRKFEKYSIKKLKVGAASVLVGAGFFFGYHVEASEVTKTESVVNANNEALGDKKINTQTSVESTLNKESRATEQPAVTGVVEEKKVETTISQTLQTAELQEKVSALQTEINRIRSNEQQKSQIEKAEKLVEEAKLLLSSNSTSQTEVDAKAKEISSLTTILKSIKAEAVAKENKNKQLIIVSDDAYFGLFFENNHKTPTLSATYKLAENENCLIVKLDGITKEFYSWGLRVGFITYYTKNDELRKILLEKTQGYLRSTTSSPSNLSQQIAVRLLDNKQSLEEKVINDKIIEERYNELKQAISKENLNSLVTVLPFNSGYFFTIKLPSNINAHEVRLKFLNEYKYGVYSMDDEHIRIAFSCLDKELIPELINKFKQCIKQF